MNSALHGGKANPCSFELLLVVKTLEERQKFVGIVHIKYNAVASYGDRLVPSMILLLISIPACSRFRVYFTAYRVDASSVQALKSHRQCVDNLQLEGLLSSHGERFLDQPRVPRIVFDQQNLSRRVFMALGPQVVLISRNHRQEKLLQSCALLYRQPV